MDYLSKYLGEEIDSAIGIVLNSTGKTNEIGTPGAQGFGVGICPPNILPAYVQPMAGTYDKASDNYGNYYCTTDGSIMCWIPRFYYKVTHDGSANINKVDIKGTDTFPTEANAIAQGYALHRAFIDGGAVKSGFFVDKYKWSLTNFINNTSGIASSIKNSNPIAAVVDTKRDALNNFAGSFSNCKSNSQAPTDTYGGAWAAAKSRGNNFAVMSIFISSALALLSLAHGQAATSTTNCAWYLTNKNYPKGNNNSGADVDDPACTFTACDDGYWATRNEARKNGTGSTFAKTTHNGQNCGVSGINGNQWEIAQGLTCIAVSKNITAITRAAEAVFTVVAHGYSAGQVIMIGGDDTAEWNALLKEKFFDVEVITSDTFKLKIRSNGASNGNYVNSSALVADYDGSGLTSISGTFYMLNDAVALKNVTGGNNLATDHFGATGVAAQFSAVDLSGLLVDGYSTHRWGSGTNQVLPFSVDRASSEYKLSALKMPKNKDSISASGTTLFGADYFLKYIRNELCPLVSADWLDGTNAGVWYVHLAVSRTFSSRYVSARACLYV